jgi:hypothetical protein
MVASVIVGGIDFDHVSQQAVVEDARSDTYLALTVKLKIFFRFESISWLVC